MPDALPAFADLQATPAEPPPDASVEAVAALMDRTTRAALARATGGLSPASVAEAWLDWAIHLASAPGTCAWLGWKAARKALRLQYSLWNAARLGDKAKPCIDPLPGDHRFDDPAWRAWPFSLMQESFLLCQQWLHNATTNVRGVSAAHQRVVAFTARQVLDMAAPSNFLPTNPLILRRTTEQGGLNLWRGAVHLAEDMVQLGAPLTANPAVGRTVAITPGRVVFRNHLIEVLQYAPQAGTVRPEPVLIVPAWIMKYYILDLAPETSLIGYLVSQGFSVFAISWRNPDAPDRDLRMRDYLDSGVAEAIRAALSITGAARLHAAGYCLGGTLLSIAAAAMARDGDDRLRSLTLFAAQQDFTEAGELTLFINESQIALLEDMMEQRGYLDSRQMAGAFRILRSNDLIWSAAVQNYLLGERPEATELMAWNADATRMPAAMHGEYLTRLFLNNDLAEGRYPVGGAPVALNDIRAPIFAVSTETDHVAPWRSVYKIHLLTDAEVTFVLTSGGHNAGIVSEPGHRGRHYRMAVRAGDGLYRAPEAFETSAPVLQGSWWPAWIAWLAARSGPDCAPPPMGRPEAGFAPLDPAPGTYVHQA